MTERLPMYTIYQRPKDYPDGYVVRRWEARWGDGEAAHSAADRVAQYAPTLEAARRLVPAGMYRLPRDPSDDPVIVETWI